MRLCRGWGREGAGSGRETGFVPSKPKFEKKKWDHEVRVKNANKKMATLIPMGKKPFASRPEDFARPFCSCNFLLRHG